MRFFGGQSHKTVRLFNSVEIFQRLLGAHREQHEEYRMTFSLDDLSRLSQKQ